MNNRNTSLVLIDTHVHIHSNYDVNIFFESVFNNFGAYANKIEKTKPWKALLLLAEMKNVNYFKKLSALKNIGKENQFRVENTNENISLKIISPEGNKIFVIAGKQIIAENNIEVLALCTGADFEQNKSLSETIKKINSENGIAVLPWGVGKWSGKRKEILTKFLTEHKNEKFYLGDNSGRPKFWPEPGLFKSGNKTKHYVLPGTDALAIPSEVNKTATYGFYVFAGVDENNPSESIKKIISGLTIPPVPFGELENIIPFFKNQITMQLNKRRNK